MFMEVHEGQRERLGASGSEQGLDTRHHVFELTRSLEYHVDHWVEDALLFLVARTQRVKKALQQARSFLTAFQLQSRADHWHGPLDCSVLAAHHVNRPRRSAQPFKACE